MNLGLLSLREPQADKFEVCLAEDSRSMAHVGYCNTNPRDPHADKSYEITKWMY
jgi:hypothetical protein